MTAYRLPLAAAFAAVLAILPAAAQTTMVEIADGTLLGPWNMTADAVEDLDVIGANGQKVGSVDEVIGPDVATPAALVVDFEEGAGFGDRENVAIPLNGFTPAQNGLLLSVSAASVANLPTWDD